MEEASILGIDLAKRSFQVHGAKEDGSVAYRRKVSRGKLLSFLASTANAALNRGQMPFRNSLASSMSVIPARASSCGNRP